MPGPATARKTTVSVFANHYYNRYKPDGSPIGELAHTERKRRLEKIRDRLRKMSGGDATDIDLYEIINVLLEAGATQADLAEKIGVGKATINRWSNRMTSPQQIIRETAIERSKAILDEIISSASIA